MASLQSNIIKLDQNEVGIFGFGSLLSLSSLERTLGHPYNKPYCTCTLPGWRRRWNITEPNEGIYAVSPTGRFFPDRILYLNIEPVQSQLLNGLLVFIDQKDLPALDRRENVYNRIEITGDIKEYKVQGGPVYTYEGKQKHRDQEIGSPHEAALQQSYLDTIEAALHQLGPSFRNQYEASTDDVPRRLVIRDRLAK